MGLGLRRAEGPGMGETCDTVVTRPWSAHYAATTALARQLLCAAASHKAWFRVRGH